MYCKLDEFGKVTESLEEALKMHEDNPKIYLKRANLYTSLGKLEKAKEDLKKVEELDPNIPGLRHEVKRLKEINEIGNQKTKNSFGGFLNKESKTSEFWRLNNQEPSQRRQRSLNH